ncbi:MAG: dephospho-CoA kinase [Pseudomonadales bacterium]|nr:dephospho-CoA kinase [Pseudomonadales bacterium]
MFVLGITGGIGSGKTAVSDRFQDLGITIVDADLCSRVVVEKGRPALNQIAEHFGNEILSADGELDRATLRTKIFSNPDDKKWLESLLHPLIGEEVFAQLAAAQSDYVILASPLLVESQQNLICDKTLVVDVPVEVQIERTCARDNNDAAQVQNIINSQANRETRLAAASDVIENSQGFDHLDMEVTRLHKHYTELALEKNRNEI